MSNIGFSLQVTVHLSQHFHHSEVMEEMDNELEKQQFRVDSCGSLQQRRGKTVTRDWPTCHSHQKTSNTSWGGHLIILQVVKNLDKIMHDNKIAPMDHYWEPNKFGKTSAV